MSPSQQAFPLLPQQMAEKMNWTPTMDYNFITTYVDWVTTKTWDPHKTMDQNWNVLAAHLREILKCLSQVNSARLG